MMRKLLTLTVLFLFVFAAGQIGWAEEVSEVIDSINNAQKQNVSQDASQVVKVLLEAETDGLPMRSLLNKVREGLAKSVDYWKIYEVLVRKKEFLQQAKEVVDEAENCGVIATNPELSIEELARLFEGGEVDETLLREICALDETYGLEFQKVLDMSSVLGNLVILGDDIKKEVMAMILENQLDENSAEEIATELEDVNLEGEDVEEALVKIRKRYQ